jgi:PAS domain S-box-containing protein
MDFSLLELVPDAILIVERETGRIAYANAVAEGMFGYRRDELRDLAIEQLLPERFRERHQAHRSAYDAAPRARPMGLGVDLMGRRRDGGEFLAEISLAPLSAEGKAFTIAAVRDVSERKRIERSAMLYRQAREELRERDEFLSVASHELRTPVTALQLQMQMLNRVAERTADGLPDVVMHKLAALERQTRRVAQLVNELLDVSRMRLGRLDLRPESMDLSELVREAVGQLREELERTGSRVEVRCGGPARGTWDRMRIEQVLTNLLVNAVKFGEGKPVEVTVSSDGETARLAVADRGIGIPVEAQARIFGRFERAVSPQHFGGLGLGLFIDRQIVEAHGGSIRLESVPGRGSTFTVELPCRPPASEERT